MYKKSLFLSLLTFTLLTAEDMKFEDIKVEGSINSMTVTDISSEELKSADLAEALSKNVPSIKLVRRSGIANDIILRGQKKDNINILIDNAKIYGACPNRMDPTTSHILTNNVDSVEVTEGPYDVENFGTLSGLVKVNTKKPTKEIEGEINANFGDFGYMKGSATVSGGTDKIRVYLGGSYEKSGQYLDGNGDNFQDQLANVMAASQYEEQYQGMDAYAKQTFMGKLFYDITKDQELKLSYTLNRSQDILYPSSMMDALYDNSDLFSTTYTLKNLGTASKALSFDYYYSFVDHPMSNIYRAGTTEATETTHALTSSIQGLKVKNISKLGNNSELTAGVDSSMRTWDGDYFTGGTDLNKDSITNALTANTALFAKVRQKYSSVDLDMGMRYDYTDITSDTTQDSRNFQSLSANIFSTFHAANKLDIFAGIGRSARVPDARELYFFNKMSKEVGTPTLDQTFNNEIDFGVEKTYKNASVKTKIFYSYLENFIAYNKTTATATSINVFENVDATIYGLSASGTYNFNDALYTDLGIAFQRGEKANALTGQTETDLAEIPPLKANISLVYQPNASHKAKADLIAVDEWKFFDAENGEQALDAYAVLNLKYAYTYAKQYSVTIGVDNVLNKVYNASNTYADLSLLTDGSTSEVLLLNEPGRYAYVNLSYKY